ncbi:hypothetical protein AAZX31_18G153400 [Glycine max]
MRWSILWSTICICGDWSTCCGYSKIFATLGVVCKCCDGVGGACTSKWTESCNNLQCFPWKSHCTKQH